MTTNDDATAWQGGLLDLDAYLRRTGYDGELAPTLDVLRALTRAHITSIPFETVEIVLGRPIPLDLRDVQDKLVHARRGGYCYEHSVLLAAVLERVGFRVTGLASRVRIGTEALRPATHAMLRVETAETPETGKVWICDPGFGRNPIEPMELADGAEASLGDWGFRLNRTLTETGNLQYTMRSRGADGWFDLHAFTLDQRYAPDWMVANHFLSTHVRSPFAGRLLVQQMRDREHLALDGSSLTTTLPDGTATTTAFAPEEVPEVLREVFGMHLPHSDHAELIARVYVARQAVALYPATVHPPAQNVPHLWAHRPGRRMGTSIC
ncbi:arylamine N-acetyltransferase [Streptomyces sp. NBC_01351]|uniref:arylamine N-acetyltransferase family protein n=1 Tax=Streptomyces sp. NBC_01351 TaxID=2903833 RepID=UPI002E373837|nr:arylamine N-acetyltransferase [Streptomyces sp. NBC_01351]